MQKHHTVESRLELEKAQRLLVGNQEGEVSSQAIVKALQLIRTADKRLRAQATRMYGRQVVENPRADL